MKKYFLFLLLLLPGLTGISQTVPSYIPTNGLVAWWPFNGNANDESGNGNNGTVNGATLTTDRNGNANSSYFFSPSNNSFIRTNTIATTISNNFTTSLWVNSLANQYLPPQGFNSNGFGSVGTQCVLHAPHGACYGPSGTNVGTGIYIGNNGVVVLEHTTGYVRASLVSQINLNGWHYITVVYNSNIPYLYVDGTFISVGTDGGLTTHPSLGFDNSGFYPNAGIGSGGGGNFYGSLDNLSIWNRALTPQEITALYQAQSCTLAVTSQPSNQNVNIGSNSSFTTGATTDCTSTINYQWQTNTGFGWQTLQNAGQYSGVNTATLNVSNVGSPNTNQLFRCIVNSGDLSDTTQTATLTVVNNNNTNLSGVTHAIPYQAVVRDGSGTPLVNHPLIVRCTLYDGNASGNTIYQETHNITTNNLGLFTLHIGTGTSSIGSMDSINWAMYKKYLQVEFDTTSQGGSYVGLGTQQLMAVPYALYAETAGNALNGPKGDKGDAGINGTNGVNGSNGINGENGADGISVTSATISNDSLYLSLSNNQTVNAGKLSGGLPNGTAAGEMLYWNGTAWVSVAPTTSLHGNQVKILKFCNGVPTWEDCPAVLPTLSTTAITNITNTAACGGNITNDGGAAVSARGICWSTSNNPTVSLSTKTIDGGGTGSFSSIMAGLDTSTTYYVRAYATNSVGTAYGNEVVFTTTNELLIGYNFQGGIIAYILQPGDPGYDANVKHGLIAAPSDQSTGTSWWNGSYVATGATATALGTGNANTNTIVAVQGNGNYAAKLCYDLELNGYSDWYLPSRDELNKLYLNQATIGGFSAANYWSSSEWDSIIIAWFQYFSDGLEFYTGKDIIHHVRAVRAF